MNRFKNAGLYLSIAAAVPMVLKGFGVDVLPANYNDIVNAILGVLVMAGILNNPTEGTWYLDRKNNITNDITNDIKK